jgi:hypothetical protein
MREASVRVTQTATTMKEAMTARCRGFFNFDRASGA